MTSDESDIKYIVAGTLKLVMFALIGAAIVAATWQFTVPRIEANKRAARLAQFAPVLAGLAITRIDYESPQLIEPPHTLPGRDHAKIYRAYAQQSLVAFVFEVSASGYSGPIELLIGVRADGAISGVRVIAHTETPGLGDKIERDKSDWIEHFVGRSLGLEPNKHWALKKDGGEFDAFTGASVTPRAIIIAVRDTLEYYARNHAALQSGDAEALR